MSDSVDVLIDAARLARRVAELGQAITRDYAGRTPVLLSVLNGSFMFAADLARTIDLPARVEFLGTSSYGDDTRSSGAVRLTHDVTRPIAGEHVIVIEDIVDTGLTLDFLLESLRARGPASLKVCALLHKPARTQRVVAIDYLGFTIDDVFVVGYGIDWAQRYRNLPYVAVPKPGATPG